MSVMSKVKKSVSKLKKNKFAKWFSALTVTSVVAALGCFACFAEDPAGTTSSGAIVSASLSTALQNMLTDFMAYAAVVLPIGLTIFGVYMGIGYAMKLFKKITGKS